MTAYNNIDEGIKGLAYGLIRRVEGEWGCQESAGIEFGAPVFGYQGDETNAYNYHSDVSKIVYSTDFVASNSTIVTVNTVATSPVVFTTDHLTTINLIVAAVAGLTGVECVLDATDSNNRTILIRTKGTEAVATSATTGGAGQPTTTITVHSGQVYLGTAMLTQNSAGLYEYQDAINVTAEGELWVEAKATVEVNKECYVITTAGATFGNWGIAGEQINARYKSNGTTGTLVRQFVYGRSDMTYAGVF
jgi:hypothetical protein